MTLPFYRAFEERYRGARELIRSRLNAYLPFLEPLVQDFGQTPSIDLGCGRGEWLEVVSQAGLRITGVDLDDGMLEACQNFDLPVVKADALHHLASLPDESQAIVSAFHFVEHIGFDHLSTVIANALRVLKPGGLLIMETPNPENLVVGATNFYLDPTHVRPIHPQLLLFMTEHAGFRRNKLLRLQEDSTLVTGREPSLLNVLSGASPDYAVVAQKDAPLAQLDKFNQAFEKEYGLTLAELANRYDNRTAKAEASARDAEAKLRIHIIEARLQEAEALARKLAAEADDNTQRAQRAEARAMDAEARASHLENEARNKERAATERINSLGASSHHWYVVATQLEIQIAQIYKSTSWRITSPIRMSKRVIVRIIKTAFYRPLKPLIAKVYTPSMASWARNQTAENSRRRALLSRLDSSLGRVQGSAPAAPEKKAENMTAHLLMSRVGAILEKSASKSGVLYLNDMIFDE